MGKRFLIHTGLLPAFLLVLLGVSCSTKKNTFVTRNYHNLTSRFNGYFYAKESMKDAQYKIDRSYIDDYSEILPIYRLANTSETKSSYPDLEKAIKKSSTVIERHAITDYNGTEIAGAVKWIDDNYLLIGKARYIKGEYLSALQTFDYVIRKYSKFPIKYDGILWKAKTNIELNGYTEAESQLDLIAHDKNCPKTLQADIQGAYADLYLHTGKYDLATKSLEKAIELTKDKKQKTRYTYILGQVYQKQGDTKKAAAAYTKVMSMHPTYDMLFNAKVNNARMSAHDPKLRSGVKHELERMLHDAKNNEYQDIIYYTLADIELQANNEDQAVRLLRMSVATSTGNQQQKALSYLALAEIFFKHSDYTVAEAYYDSTMGVLPKTYPDYNNIDETRKSLNTLVRYINVVKLEDSLQNVVNTYGTDTTKLYPYIDKLIEKIKEKEKRDQEEKDRGNNGFQPNNIVNGGNGTGGGNSGSSGGTWYFYNPSTVSFGISEFNKKWGTRKLEDNWRRANKETIIEDPGTPGDSNDVKKGVTTAVKGDNKTRAYYLKPLPLTPALMDSSNGKIADAYFNLGSIYKEQIHNDPKAIEAFSKLTERFPTHKYSGPSHFQLYRLYKAKHDDVNAKIHADWLRKNMPNSEYTQILDNPDYEAGKMNDEKRLEAFYAETYTNFYTSGNYTGTIDRCTQAEKDFGKKNTYAARFAFLKSMSIGHTQGVDSLERSLTRLVVNYPRDPVKLQAQGILDAIHRQRGDKPTADTSAKATTTVPSIYSKNENGEYQVMILVPKGSGNVNRFRQALSDFDSENYSSDSLQINSVLLDANTQLITVKAFNGLKRSMSYYELLKTNPKVFADLTAGSWQLYPISSENYMVFFKDKKVETYKAFFEKELQGKK